MTPNPTPTQQAVGPRGDALLSDNDASLLAHAITIAREVQEFIWAECYPSLRPYDAQGWRRLFQKRVDCIAQVDLTKHGGLAALRKRLLQQAALSIKALALVNRWAKTNPPQISAGSDGADLSAAASSPAPTEKLPLPTDYECIAPSEQVYVINLLRGICDADKQEVARLHLNLCARCQELAGGAAPGAQVAEERESLIIAGNREEAIRLLRQLRETADPEEIQRQKESWAQLEAALNPAAKGDR